MSLLADAVLPLIRTRADLHRYSAATAHGRQMHEAVDILEHAAGTEDPGVVLTVTQKAIASAMSVIMRADDSAGIIGDACRRLLALHPRVAAEAGVGPAALVDWMLRFQFAHECDYFELDPVAYAPALGEVGMAPYRRRLDEVRAGLGAEPAPRERWSSPDAGTWSTLEWNAQRLAVLDRDAEAIIRTHAKDGSVAAWLQDAAEAFEEIGDLDRAVEWARRATDHPGGGYPSMRAAGYWCRLLAEHRPDELFAARQAVFERWPSSSTAADLQLAAGERWPELMDAVFDRLADRPRDAVILALVHLRDVRLAWELAHSLQLEDGDAWTRLVAQYEKVDAVAVLPVLARLVDGDLETAGAQNYRTAARRLRRMRELAGGTGEAAGVDELVAELRGVHRRRPRLQQEFERAGLP